MAAIRGHRRHGRRGVRHDHGATEEHDRPGGENIYPAEIEALYFEHPKVADIAIFGLPDERLGEDVAAWVRLHPGEACTADELRDWARGRIAHHKIPRRVWFVDEFPETVTGKVQKFRMQETSAGWLKEAS